MCIRDREVGYLMDLFANNFRTIADEMNERGCKVPVSYTHLDVYKRQVF